MVKKSNFLYYIYVIYTLEIGLILFLIPWLNIWESNYFFQKNIYLGEIMRNPYMRGAVSGLGIVTVLIAFGETVKTNKLSS